MNARLPFVVVAVFAACPHDFIIPAGYKNCTLIGETIVPARSQKARGNDAAQSDHLMRGHRLG